MIKKYPFLLSVFALFFSCDRLQENESNIWVGSEIYYNGNLAYPLGLNRSVLNFNNLKSYHVGLMKYNDSIHIKDSINIKGFVWKFKSKIKDRLIYEFDNDTNYIMTFMRIKKADSYLSFDKVLSKNWYRTLLKENESFVIDENYDFTYPQLTINRHYFLDQNPVYFEIEFYKIDTLSISNNHFLILKQNKTFFIDQITHYDNSNLTLYNYNSLHGSEGKFTDIPLKKKETSFKVAQNFELCKSGEIIQYYYDEIGISNSGNRQEKFSYFLKY